jgi:hypothetical protein
VYPQDTDFGNNQAQRNVHIKPTGSPASFQLLVTNPTAEALTIDLSVELTGACPWDLDHNGTVGVSDYQIFAGALFGTSCGADWVLCPGDFDSDDHIDAADFTIFQAHFMQACPPDWTFTPSANGFVLGGDECPLPVTLLLDPGASVAPSAVARVSVTGTPPVGPPIDLGGVTLIGVKSKEVPAIGGVSGFVSLAVALLGSGLAVFVLRRAR